MGTEEAIELEVQRRVTAALSSAGIAESVIAASGVWMMPSELTQAYTQLFSRALRLDTAGSGVVRESGLRVGKKGRDGSPGRAKIDRGESRGSWRGSGGGVSGIQGVMAGVGAGGKRFREHWLIKDEGAFELKRSIDRKLKRLASEILRGLGQPPPHSITCARCRNDLGFHAELGDIRLCPYCGAAKETWLYEVRRVGRRVGGSQPTRADPSDPQSS